MNTGNQETAQALSALGWTFTAVLLLVVLICWAAGSGMLQANSTIGIRIPPVTLSDAAWKAGHAAGRIPALVAFAVSLVCSAVGLFESLAYFGAITAFIGGLFGWLPQQSVQQTSPFKGYLT